MRPGKPPRPWMQVWRDWLDALPLRNDPIEPELSSQAFGASTTARAEPPSVPPASDRPKSRPATDARPPTA